MPVHAQRTLTANKERRRRTNENRRTTKKNQEQRDTIQNPQDRSKSTNDKNKDDQKTAKQQNSQGAGARPRTVCIREQPPVVRVDVSPRQPHDAELAVWEPLLQPAAVPLAVPLRGVEARPSLRGEDDEDEDEEEEACGSRAHASLFACIRRITH